MSRHDGLRQASPVRKDQLHARQVDQQEQRPYPAPQIVHLTTLSIMSLMLICLSLLGCASAPQTVSVPVAVSCLPAEVPALPSILSNDALQQLADRDLVLTLAAERLDLLAYSRQADAIISGCK